MTAIDLRQLTADGSIDTVAVAFPDLYGRLMGKRVPASWFVDQVLGGEMMACDYLLTADMELEPIPGFDFSSWDSGYGDMQLVPDLDSARLTPWLPGSAVVLCDLVSEHDGEHIPMAPRQLLQGQLAACAELGLRPMMASELEFYLFKGAAPALEALTPTTDYLIDYHLLGTARDEPLLREIRAMLPRAGIPVESTKGEWGRGQHEVNIVYCPALEMADRHVLLKEAIKLLAAAHDVAATFMAKVQHDMAGSSCHIHTSLLDEQGHNAFWDKDAGAASPLFEHFLAGCMAHAQELAWFFAPTVNSYKRYQAASFAPTSVAWARDNRTCGFRVVGTGQSLRIENRIPGADANPYLAFAATLAAGLDGIQRKLPLPPAVKGNAYEAAGVERVPTTMHQAIEALAASTLATSAFGAPVVDHYLRFARHELACYESQVSDWERRRYFHRG